MPPFCDRLTVRQYSIGTSQISHIPGQNRASPAFSRCLNVLDWIWEVGEVIDYRLLGPLEIVVDGHALDVGGRKQLALLAILLLHANQPVPRDVLIDQLWGEHPPAQPDHAVDVYIWRLRRTLDPVAQRPCVLTRPRGYVLEASPEQIDLVMFEHLARAGERSLAAGEVAKAAGQLQEALGLWRGTPLADFTDETFAQAEIIRLEELHAEVVETRIDTDLALGKHARLVGELENIVATQPLRERPYQQLMIALYRCGRQAEALAVYQRARRALVDELGIEPGQQLRELELAILRQDQSLELSGQLAAPRSVLGEPQPGRAGLTSVGAGRRLLAAGGALGIDARAGGSGNRPRNRPTQPERGLACDDRRCNGTSQRCGDWGWATKRDRVRGRGCLGHRQRR